VPGPSGTLPPAAPPVASASAPAPAVGAPPATAEQRDYDAALDQFKAGKFPTAITSFTSFVKTYPRSPLAPSAQYWIGSAQFAQKDYRGAINSQRQLVSAYPDSAKVPDGLLTIASSQFELGDSAASRRTLEDLIKKYPQSEAAAKARQRLAIR
jgi:tol-pal system protein YbgF